MLFLPGRSGEEFLFSFYIFCAIIMIDYEKNKE